MLDQALKIVYRDPAKRPTRQRACIDCGREDTIRRDNQGVRCGRCASKAHAKYGPVAPRKECPICGSSMRASLPHTYCSRGCRGVSLRTARQCKACGVEFSVLSSTISGRTNASGNFCSRPCYEHWLCDTDRTKHRGSRWKQHRQEAIRRAPFCAICGRMKQLDVHHIVPYRLTNDNRQVNLIPLCKKHHKMVEVITVDVLAVTPSPIGLLLAFGGSLRDRQAVTFLKLRELTRESPGLAA